MNHYDDTTNVKQRVKGRCECGCGRPARFEGFGHKFSWECYREWMDSFRSQQPELLFEEPQLSLNY